MLSFILLNYPPVKFVEANILLFHQSKRHTLFNNLPDPQCLIRHFTNRDMKSVYECFWIFLMKSFFSTLDIPSYAPIYPEDTSSESYPFAFWLYIHMCCSLCFKYFGNCFLNIIQWITNFILGLKFSKFRFEMSITFYIFIMHVFSWVSLLFLYQL